MGLDKCTSLQSQLQEAVLMAHKTLDFTQINYMAMAHALY